MKTILTKSQLALIAVVAGIAFPGRADAATEPTAFELVKEGNRYVGEQSKDRIVEIRSEKSIGSLSPEIWYVVYYDPDAPLKAVEVKFGAGKKMGVKRPARLTEPIGRAHEPLEKDKLKIDSDAATKIASNEPLLAHLKLKATSLRLERCSADDDTPVWRIRLWAAKLKNPNDNTEVGEVVMSAVDGKVLKSDLKPQRVD